MQVGDVEGPNHEFIFGNNFKIDAATLYGQTQIKPNSGVWNLSFMMRKHRCLVNVAHCDPMSVDVKSGRCYGITGRSNGKEIVALGFYFI